MRKIREVLRLYFAAALSIRAIARSVGTSPSTVADYLRRAEGSGLSWPVPEAIDDVGLERRLFPALPPSSLSRPLPEWSEVHRELGRKGVTLSLLWQEYKALHPEGLQYSWFCEQYRAWAGKLDLVMRQEHRAGEKLFVDYAGQTVPVVDPETGEVREAQVFVAVLGASNYTFAEATWTQTLPDWTASHVRAFEFFGGCPELVIPDNLRSGVSRADSLRAGPESELSRPRPPLRRGGAAGTGASSPGQGEGGGGGPGGRAVDTRRASPSDVLLAGRTERRDRQAARTAQHATVSQASGIATLVFRAARPAGAAPPAGQSLRLRRVEVRARAPRLPRRRSRSPLLGSSRAGPAPTRCPSDGPHRRVFPPRPARRQPRPLLAPGASYHRAGAHAGATPPDGRMDARVLHPPGREGRAPDRRPGHRRPERRGRHPQQACRSCLGLLRLARCYGDARMEAAAARALAIRSYSYRSVESILHHRLDATAAKPVERADPVRHDNIRGALYSQ